MSPPRPSEAMRDLFRAAMIEAVCIGGGIAGFIVTGNWTWLVGGVLLGLGFSLPALITYLRSKG